MLYDKKWDKKLPVAPRDPMSLDSLIAWLETKNPFKRYRYLSNENCLLAQYFTDMGYKDVHVWAYNFRYDNDGEYGNELLPYHFNNIAFGKYLLFSRTFGGALRYAKQLRAKELVAA